MHADALKTFALAQLATMTTTTTQTTFSVVICKFFMHAEQAKIPITHLILTRGEKFCSSSALPLLVSKRARRRTENVLQCLPSLSLEKGFYSHWPPSESTTNNQTFDPWKSLLSFCVCVSVTELKGGRGPLLCRHLLKLDISVWAHCIAIVWCNCCNFFLSCDLYILQNRTLLIWQIETCEYNTFVDR